MHSGLEIERDDVSCKTAVAGNQDAQAEAFHFRSEELVTLQRLAATGCRHVGQGRE
jgi:hypothetical protein